MKRSKIFAGVMGAFLSVVLCTVAVGQDKATAQEVVAKVREAASTLSKTGDVAQFNQKQSPWVWKNTYIFVEDCDKKVMAAQPGHLERLLVAEARREGGLPQDQLSLECPRDPLLGFLRDNSLTVPWGDNYPRRGLRRQGNHRGAAKAEQHEITVGPHPPPH